MPDAIMDLTRNTHAMVDSPLVTRSDATMREIKHKASQNSEREKRREVNRILNSEEDKPGGIWI